MRRFYAALAEWERAGLPFTLVTLLDAQGSTPRQAGTKMAVGATQVLGTIGGGTLEFRPSPWPAACSPIGRPARSRGNGRWGRPWGNVAEAA